MRKLGPVLAGLLLALLGYFAWMEFGEADKIEADAYICGEPPDEVTFYCTPGTGPPRNDCSAPQTGEFDIEGTTDC